MLLTGPGSGARSASIRSISETYQRTPSMARSTSAWASFQGLPISQTRSRASSSRCSVSASRVAEILALRSVNGTWRQARCWSREARTACSAASASRRGGPAMGVPSTGLVAGSGSPSGCQAPAHRLRARSSRNASGAAARLRCQASCQDVPGLRMSVGAGVARASRCAFEVDGEVGAIVVSALGARPEGQGGGARAVPGEPRYWTVVGMGALRDGPASGMASVTRPARRGHPGEAVGVGGERGTSDRGRGARCVTWPRGTAGGEVAGG